MVTIDGCGLLEVMNIVKTREHFASVVSVPLFLNRAMIVSNCTQKLIILFPHILYFVFIVHLSTLYLCIVLVVDLCNLRAVNVYHDQAGQ